MGIAILSVIIILMLFGFGEKLLAGTGIPAWLAFVISTLFLGAFFIPEIRIGKFGINVAGFILPIAISVLFAVLLKSKSELIKTSLAMITIALIVFGIRFFCMDLGKNAVMVSTLVSGFLSGIAAYFITNSAKGVVSSVFGGIVLGDLAFALLDYFVYKADGIYLGIRGNYNAMVIGTVFGLIVFAIMNVIIGTFRSARKTKGLKNSETAEDVTIDKSETDKFDSFFE